MGTVLVALVVFRCVLGADTVLFTTDDNIGYLNYTKANLPSAFLYRWVENPLVGYPSYMPFKWTFLLLWLLPLQIFVDWHHAIALGIASLFLAMFLRLHGRSWVASALAVLVAFWLGTNLTLSYAGHISKYGVLMFSAISLYCIEKAARTRRPAWGILAGGSVGGMFLEQQDVALFIGLFWGLYAVVAVLREEGWRPKRSIVRLLLMGLVVALVAGPSVLRVYTVSVHGVASMSEEDPQAKWEFCTQWSVPPDETIDLIAPGYTGWRSGEPDGPYWGRTGQAAEWEKTRKGLMNLRLESIYLGAIPVVLACFALFVALPVVLRKRSGGDEDGGISDEDRKMAVNIVFWGGAVLLTLLLSYGKHFPLYRWFYALPGISSIRCPNKFVHAFQIGVAILAAYGFDLAAGQGRLGSRRTKAFAYATCGLAAVLAIWAIVLLGARASSVAHFEAEGWGQHAAIIVANRISGLWHGVVMTLCAAAFLFWRVFFPKGNRIALGGVRWAVLLVVVADVLLLSRHYIKPMRLEGNVDENAVVKFLKTNLNHRRVMMLSQGGFYNNWLSVSFPYHSITTFNVAQMPRMPEDYKQFLGVVGRNPVRMWQLASVGYVLTPSDLWKRLQADPRFSKLLEPAMGFNVFPYAGGIGVSAVPPTDQAQHMILKFNQGIERYSLVGDWAVAPEAGIPGQLAQPSFDPNKRALITEETAGSLPSPVGATGGAVTVQSYRRGNVKLTVEADGPCILVISEKYAPYWKASVDGEQRDVMRCNYIFQGVYVDGGKHDVHLRYAPPIGGLYVQAAGILLCLGALGALMLAPKKKDA